MLDESDIHNLFMRVTCRSAEDLSSMLQQCMDVLTAHLSLQSMYIAQVRDAGERIICFHDTGTLLPELTIGASPPIATQDDPLPHIRLPIKHPNGAQLGTIYGAFYAGLPTITDSNHRLLRAVSELIAAQISVIEALGDADDAPAPTSPSRPASAPPALKKTAAAPPVDESKDIALTLAHNNITPLFQPIIGLQDMKTRGFEGLSRFPALRQQNVQTVFDAAHRSGLGPELEIQAVRQLITQTHDRLDELGFVSFNLSQSVLQMETLQVLYERGCEGVPKNGYIVEISEAEAVENFCELRTALVRMRQAGLKIAIDDVGAGQSGLRHILMLEPDIIKIDVSVTARIETHTASRAMMAALNSYGAQTDCEIIAEGIETSEQLNILRGLGTSMGQGFLLGRPASLPAAKQERVTPPVAQMAS
ncbi:EAL domain-containing protein [Albirhodobacter sp. R86504]|uniref:EAL domain-containing protein n=1 Tax=Albirhodobacter sp. R86504 TaxID=3093848 RepID=UPI003671EC35